MAVLGYIGYAIIAVSGVGLVKALFFDDRKKKNANNEIATDMLYNKLLVRKPRPRR